MDESKLQVIPFADYNAARDEYLTSGAYREFLASPLVYHQRDFGVLPPKASSAFGFGRAFHEYLDGGKDGMLRAGYVVSDPPTNQKTGAPFGADTKAAAEWRASLTGEPVTTADMAAIRAMAANVNAHPVVRDLYEQADAHYSERTIRAEIAGVACQCRPDVLLRNGGTLTLLDWKTTSDIEWFAADARKYGYGTQMDFYAAVMQAAGLDAGDAYLVACESVAPYRVGVWKYSIMPGVRENVARLADCRARNVWPSGYEQLRLL